MKEYLLKFTHPEKGDKNRRLLLSTTDYKKFKDFEGKADKNGITLLSIEEIKGITAKDFIPKI